MRVLGVDLSLTETGHAERLTSGTIAGITLRSKLKGSERLHALACQIVLGNAPDSWLIEDIPMHAKSAGLTAQLHGAVKYRAFDMLWPDPILIPPATLKVFATGRGNADKTAMVVAARDRLGYTGENNNVADAMWLCELGCHLAGQPTVTLPKSHLRALEKLDVA